MVKVFNTSRGSIVYRSIFRAVEMRILWVNTRVSARGLYSAARNQAEKSRHSVVEGETTYAFDRSERSLYLEEHAVFRRHMTVSMLRTLANLHNKHLKRKSTEEEQPSAGQFNKFNTHITGLAMSNILNISNAPGNDLALMRYAVEIPDLKNIAIAQNVNHHVLRKNMEEQGCRNKFRFLERADDRRTVQEVVADQRKHTYDAVVIDGTKFPTKAVCNSAVKCVKDGGLISLSFPSFKYYAKGRPIETQYNSELTLRSCLHKLYSGSVLNFGARMLPLVCYSYRGMVQIFVRVFFSDKRFSSQFPGQTGTLHHCPQCTNFSVDFENLQHKRCNQCRSAMQASEPLWMSPYADSQMVFALYEDVKKHHRKHLTGEEMLFLLSHLEQEVPDGLFFHHPQNYKVKFGLQKLVPVNLFMSALENMGYATSLTHLRKNCVKTSAPPDAVWDVMRKWTEIFPGKDTDISPLLSQVLDKQPERNVNFHINNEVYKKLCRLRDRAKSLVGK